MRGTGVADSEMRAMGWAQSFPHVPRSAGRAPLGAGTSRLAGMGAERTRYGGIGASGSGRAITNAHRHAHSNAQLVLTWDSTCLHVSVHDASPKPPAPSDRDLDATGGRGLTIVEALSASWEHHPQRDGKTVTACFVPP